VSPETQLHAERSVHVPILYDVQVFEIASLALPWGLSYAYIAGCASVDMQMSGAT
jgi:hypothetical protein